MKLYTYYSNVPGISPFDSTKLINLWMEHWKAVGFEPFVLTEFHARKHPYFQVFNEAVFKLPTVNPALYEAACYHRWLSMAQIGGGILMDYDVFPIDVTKIHNSLQKYRDEPLTVFQNRNCCPSMVNGTAEAYLDQCHRFANYKLTGKELEQGRPHTSDMLILEQRALNEPDSFALTNLVRCWGEQDNETGAIHFNNGSMTPKGLTPRWQCIPSLIDEARSK